MTAKSDLAVLLAEMQPVLHQQSYVFVSVPADTLASLSEPPLGTFQEDEGLTLILAESQARALGQPVDPPWACITLQVHSALNAVGFLAVVTTCLARAGISANPVSAYYHDHIFVPWPERERALEALLAVSASYSAPENFN